MPQTAYLQGNFPTTWNTPKLENLVLNHNYLTGPLSDDIGKCASPKQLIFPDNKISGNFPENYGNLHQLVSLNLL